MPWDDDLDPESPAFGIARASTQYVRVVAGPGTGKSFALKRRVARLLEEGIDPTTILPVTFTNVAAEDLQREILNVGVLGCENIRGSTLHSLGMRILSAQHGLQVIGRVPRPLNKFETRWCQSQPAGNLTISPMSFGPGSVSSSTGMLPMRCSRRW